MLTETLASGLGPQSNNRPRVVSGRAMTPRIVGFPRQTPSHHVSRHFVNPGSARSLVEAEPAANAQESGRHTAAWTTTARFGDASSVRRPPAGPPCPRCTSMRCRSAWSPARNCPSLLADARHIGQGREVVSAHTRTPFPAPESIRGLAAALGAGRHSRQVTALRTSAGRPTVHGFPPARLGGSCPCWALSVHGLCRPRPARTILDPRVSRLPSGALFGAGFRRASRLP
jgi:hypothetical protein